MNPIQKAYETFNQNNGSFRIDDILLHKKKIFHIKSRNIKPLSKSQTMSKSTLRRKDDYSLFNKKKEDQFLKERLSKISSQSSIERINKKYEQIEQMRLSQNTKLFLSHKKETDFIKQENSKIIQRLGRIKSTFETDKMLNNYSEHLKLVKRCKKVKQLLFLNSCYSPSTFNNFPNIMKKNYSQGSMNIKQDYSFNKSMGLSYKRDKGKGCIGMMKTKTIKIGNKESFRSDNNGQAKVFDKDFCGDYGDYTPIIVSPVKTNKGNP